MHRAFPNPSCDRTGKPRVFRKGSLLSNTSRAIDLRKAPPAAADDRVSRIVARSDGDLAEAIRRVDAAIRREPADAGLRLAGARLKELAGDRAGAATDLTRALRLAPRDAEAARRLVVVLSEGVLPEATLLDQAGLAAALAHPLVDADLLGAVAIRELKKRRPLAAALARAKSVGQQDAVRGVLSRRSSELLRDGLLIAALTYAVVTDPDVERLLLALRRALLLETPPEQLLRRELARFVAALGEQCRLTEHVLAASDAERSALALQPPDIAAALAGDRVAGARLAVHALYSDPVTLLPADTALNDVAGLHPPELYAFFTTALRERDRISTARHRIDRLGVISDETSQKVQRQYEKNPYPRWRAVQTFEAGRYPDYLASFFEARELRFLKGPFDVLVAGCGTGCQAVSAALDYGPAARIVGLDLSDASLGYAAMMAERLGATNTRFVQGDITRVGSFEPSWAGRFQVVECSGVLHHMADPFGAWRGLLPCLAPGGIMLVGLYSRLARRDLPALRALPDCPGPDCDDDTLRTWRRRLIDRPPGATGERYLKARDTFTTSGFRDFFLHVNEKPTSLDEIAAFLDANDLAFRGFVTVPFEVLAHRFPGQTWPGPLGRWAELEAERPDLFLGMYQFWASRR
jgi:SAM-dependent methyltransferase